MTEAEWLRCETPLDMLCHLRGERVLSPVLADPLLCQWVLACRRYTGLGFPPESAPDVIDWWAQRNLYDGSFPSPERAALLRDVMGNVFQPVALPFCRRCYRCGVTSSVKDRQATICVCGTWIDAEPVCPYLTPTVLSLARAARDHADYRGLLNPVRLLPLADAMEEAGCDTRALLMHLRGWMPCVVCGASDNRAGTVPRGAPDGYSSGSRCTYCAGPGWPVGWQPLHGAHCRDCWAIRLTAGD